MRSGTPTATWAGSWTSCTASSERRPVPALLARRGLFLAPRLVPVRLPGYSGQNSCSGEFARSA
eukprot:2596923-Pyramimonas_sp.AAC.2